ncbi:putative transcription factor C2H2 family [Helianthus anomalus]
MQECYNVHEAWFANEDKVRRAIGLLDKTEVKLPKAGELLCGICFEWYSLDKICSAACGHPFCNSCWTGYFLNYMNWLILNEKHQPQVLFALHFS